jgi:hypothetical protein
MEEIQCAVRRELNVIKTCFPGGHDEFEGTCKLMY